MANLNKVFLIGNLTADPELRYTPNGAAVADLRLAVNRYFTSGDDKREETLFIDVVVWQKQAENCSQYLSKGRSVFVEGRLKLDTWENQQGEKRSKLRVRADRVQFLGTPGKSTEYAGAPAAESQPPHPTTALPEINDDDVPF